MRVKRVKPHEIPLRLLEQKKMWDVRVFYEFAIAHGHEWWAYVVDEGDELDPCAAFIITDNPLYRAVSCQTIIVDKARRTPERVAQVAILAHEVALALARSLGRQYAGCAVKDPDKFIALLGNPKVEVLEHIVREEV